MKAGRHRTFDKDIALIKQWKFFGPMGTRVRPIGSDPCDGH